jgi:hypothetical protein
MNKTKIIKDLLKLSPRSAENEIKVVNFLINLLKSRNIDHEIQYFNNYYPKEKVCELDVDGVSVKSRSCCFESGVIRRKKIVNSIDFDCRKNRNLISYNPKCEEISLSTYYKKASIAINKSDIKKIKNLRSLKGEVIISKKKFKSANIIVGNKVNPRNILFCHFDSVLKGAVDNASGVGVLIDLICNYKNLLKNNLFVFSGSEEISYDWPNYWGYGYRIFENRYLKILYQVRKIIIVDSVGNGRCQNSQDYNLQKLAFPINNLKKIRKKVFIIHGNMNKLMQVYHSELDDISCINEKYLNQVVKLILKIIN